MRRPDKSLPDNGRMPSAPALDRSRSRRRLTLRRVEPGALLDRRAGRRGAAPSRLRGRDRVRDAAARGRPGGVAGGLAADGARSAGPPRRARAWRRREPNRGVSVASPDPESVRDVSTARTVLETAGVRNWAEASEEARAAVRRALADYERRRGDRRVVPGAQPAPPRDPPEPGRPDRLAPAGLDGGVDRRRAAARAGPDRPGPPQRPRPGRQPPPPSRPAGVGRHRCGGRRAQPSTCTAPRTRSSSGSTSTEVVPTRLRATRTDGPAGAAGDTTARGTRLPPMLAGCAS